MYGKLVVPKHNLIIALFHSRKSDSVGCSCGKMCASDNSVESEVINSSSVFPSHLIMSETCIKLRHRRTMFRDSRSLLLYPNQKKSDIRDRSPSRMPETDWSLESEVLPQKNKGAAIDF